MKTEMAWQFFTKLSNIKFHENPFSSSQVASCVKVDKWNDQTLAALLRIANTHKNWNPLQLKNDWLWTRYLWFDFWQGKTFSYFPSWAEWFIQPHILLMSVDFFLWCKVIRVWSRSFTFIQCQDYAKLSRELHLMALSPFTALNNGNFYLSPHFLTFVSAQHSICHTST